MLRDEYNVPHCSLEMGELVRNVTCFLLRDNLGGMGRKGNRCFLQIALYQPYPVYELSVNYEFLNISCGKKSTYISNIHCRPFFHNQQMHQSILIKDRQCTYINFNLLPIRILNRRIITFDPNILYELCRKTWFTDTSYAIGKKVSSKSCLTILKRRLFHLGNSSEVEIGGVRWCSSGNPVPLLRSAPPPSFLLKTMGTKLTSS